MRPDHISDEPQNDGLVRTEPHRVQMSGKILSRREAQVASVTVFVDDAVLGRLPAVCVVDGVATTDRLTFSQAVGSRPGLGLAWLLVLAGPLGWLGLTLVAAFRRSGEVLTVMLPYSEAAHLRRMQAERARRTEVLVAAGALVLAFVALLQRTTDYRLLAFGLAAFASGAAISAVIHSIKLHRLTIYSNLDASRRWVTLLGVHPEFVAAFQSQDSQLQSSVSP
jgi:hypothetical protein